MYLFYCLLETPIWVVRQVYGANGEKKNTGLSVGVNEFTSQHWLILILCRRSQECYIRRSNGTETWKEK